MREIDIHLQLLCFMDPCLKSGETGPSILALYNIPLGNALPSLGDFSSAATTAVKRKAVTMNHFMALREKRTS